MDKKVEVKHVKTIVPVKVHDKATYIAWRFGWTIPDAYTFLLSNWLYAADPEDVAQALAVELHLTLPPLEPEFLEEDNEAV